MGHRSRSDTTRCGSVAPGSSTWGLSPERQAPSPGALASGVHARRQCAQQFPKREWDTVGGSVHSEDQCGIVLPISRAECSLLVAAKRLAARMTGWPAVTLPQSRALCGLRGSWERGAVGKRQKPEVAFGRPRRNSSLG